MLVPGSSLADTFHLRHPYVALDFSIIVNEHLNNSFLLKATSNGMELKGEMIPTQMPHAPGCPAMRDVLLFMGCEAGSGCCCWQPPSYRRVSPCIAPALAAQLSGRRSLLLLEPHQPPSCCLAALRRTAICLVAAAA
jgi:hypothetical protein